MRIDRNIKEKGHDPYGEARKHTEGAFCPECQAVYQGGRWIWPDKPVRSGTPLLCSACRRIRDDFPAGELYLSGSYLIKHKGEIENLVQKLIREARERSPLKRMMNIREEDEGLCVRLTDDHLARHIGDAVYRAYKGDLQLKYSEEEKFVRLYWHRDE
ncbi:MAG TPA: BCAM0308 family protein [Deltaproteobacteria bacterium]|nr:BCAM0308 family protein [Deltaproteobacteria bacterium]HPR54381.1 BCAM0308 family protein [Deltaproteobacteria bacterium]HXK48562.1 BCAM0308 family protein [Deltaproteobacteria bacterium]